MKQVRFQSRTTKSVLGRLAPSGAIARQINADITTPLWWDTPAANGNFSPDAVPDTGLLASTRVKTPQGVTQLCDLARGDLVLDHTGQETKVLSVSAAGKSRHALCLRAPYFGLDQDLVLGSNQTLWMTSDRAEQMFGVEDVLMPVWALKNHSRIQFIELKSKDTLLEVKLESGNALMIGGCAVASKPVAGAEPGAYLLSDAEARGFSSFYRSGYFKT